MKKITSPIIVKFLTIGLAIAAWTTSNISAHASDFVFDLTQFTGNPAHVQVIVSDNGNGSLHFNVAQTDSTYNSPPTDEGDLRGLFFHVNENLIAPEDLTFSNFIAWGYDNNGIFQNNLGVDLIDPDNIYTGNVGQYNEVSSGGPQNNVNPKTFDIGLQFGTPGDNPESILGVSFDVTIIGGLNQMTFMPTNMEDFIGARVTSLSELNGLPGSSKLSCCGTTVPEPSSTMGLLAFAFGGLLWRRRIAA